jgi:hypothetical protein
VRAVTASCSPPPKVDRGWRTFYARHIRPRWPAPASLSSCVSRPAHTCAALLIANGGHMEGNERSLRALADSGHVRSVRAPVPAGSSGTCRRARRDLPECSLGRQGRGSATPLPPPGAYAHPHGPESFDASVRTSKRPSVSVGSPSCDIGPRTARPPS